MTSAIARWHSNARPPSDALEQAYADQLEAEMQEMAIQLHKVHTKIAVNRYPLHYERILFISCVFLCVALCRGGVSRGSGVSGEGVACSDGGMSDGGEDGVEELSCRTARERQTRSDAKRKTARAAQHSHGTRAGHPGRWAIRG